MSTTKKQPKPYRILTSPKDDLVLRQKLLPHGPGPSSPEELAALKAVGERMLITMYASNGLGLASPQVGLKYRLIVMDLGWKRRNGTICKEPQIWLDPEWQLDPEPARNRRIVAEEGCLSEPGIFKPMEREVRIIARGLDLLAGGRMKQVVMDGLEARCFQHECDHLDGVLFTDYL